MVRRSKEKYDPAQTGITQGFRNALHYGNTLVQMKRGVKQCKSNALRLVEGYEADVRS